MKNRNLFFSLHLSILLLLHTHLLHPVYTTPLSYPLHSTLALNHHVSSRAIPFRRFPPDTYFSRGRASMCVGEPRTVRWVFQNHFNQLNRCSVSGLKRERTPQTQLFFGQDVIRGEKAVDDVFEGFCRPRGEDGLKGLVFKEEKAFIVGNVISVRWVADAPFLMEPYRGSDAYVTCGYKMLTIVSSFDVNELKFK